MTSAGEHDHAAEREAVLEAVAGAHAVEPRLALAHEVACRTRGRRARARAPACRRSPAASPPIIECSCHSRPRSSMPDSDTRRDQQADEHQQQAGELEEVGRREQQHEADVPPRVAQAGELGLAAPRVVGDRDLVDLQLAPQRVDHHLGGELHAGGLQAHPLVGVARKARMPQWESQTLVRKAAAACRRGSGCRSSGATRASRPAGCFPRAGAHDHVGARRERLTTNRGMAEVVASSASPITM